MDPNNILNVAGTKVGDLIGRFLPEPSKEKGGIALNVAMIAVAALTVVSLLTSGLFVAIIEFVILAGAVILGMYAGGPVFMRLEEERDRRNDGPNPPTHGSRRERGPGFPTT